MNVQDLQIGTVFKLKTEVFFEIASQSKVKCCNEGTLMTFLKNERESPSSGWFVCYFYFESEIHKCYFHETSVLNKTLELIC